jgi:orotidine-5'-phosphate decarboxylase
MNQATLQEIGVQIDMAQHVLNLALLTEKSGLDGVVCSALEAELLRKHVADTFVLVTPGIRPASASKDDQTRIVTPMQALSLGANYLVVGRPITQAQDPLVALTAIHQEIQTF